MPKLTSKRLSEIKTQLLQACDKAREEGIRPNGTVYGVTRSLGDGISGVGEVWRAYSLALCPIGALVLGEKAPEGVLVPTEHAAQLLELTLRQVWAFSHGFDGHHVELKDRDERALYRLGRTLRRELDQQEQTDEDPVPPT